MIKRNRPFNTRSLIVLFVLAYLAVLFAGLFFIYFSNFNIHRKRYLNLCESYARIYQSVRHVGGVDHVGVGIVYAPDGNVTYTFGKTSFFSMRSDYIYDKGRGFLSPAILGQQVYRFVPFAPDKSEFGYTSLIFAMTPVSDTNNNTGILCYVFEASNYLTLSIGYAVIITIFAALLLVIMLAYNKRIIQYDEAQKKYVDNVTHEMKTPVASIKALAEALSDNMDNDENERDIYCGLILKEANRQERMIKNILELSKIQSDVADFSVKKTTPEDIFDEVCDNYRSRCEMMDIAFKVDFDIHALPALRTNAEQIRELLNILLSNAMKFTAQDEGIVRLSYAQSRKKIIVCVEDNGIGISEEDLPHICERFYRSSSASRYSGSGIGLAIADGIIERLGENMWFESELGKGTKVFFTIKTEGI